MHEPFEREGVAGILHRPAFPTGDAIVLTHGAGSDCRAAVLEHMADAFTEAGYVALRYDLPFRRAQPKGPPSPPGAARDREGVAAAIHAVRRFAPGRVFAGGHSYGGRMTAMAAAEHHGLTDALLLLSYPLHPPNKPDRPRTAFFPDLRTRVLFVHGTQDAFASLEELRQAMASIAAPTDLLPVEGAGHDLRRAAGLSAAVLERWRALLCYPKN